MTPAVVSWEGAWTVFSLRLIAGCASSEVLVGEEKSCPNCVLSSTDFWFDSFEPDLCFNELCLTLIIVTFVVEWALRLRL